MSKPTCYYLFRATFSLLGQTKEYYTSSKKFENENLISAREAAFDHYDNFIHGLLVGQGLTERESKDITDRGIRKVIYPYIDPKTFSEITNGSGENEIVHTIADYIGNEISVSLIIENDELIIHSIKKDSADMPYPVNYFNLESEYNFYEQNNYDTKDYLTTINYFDLDEYEEGFEATALGEHLILKTPFDSTGYDKKNWWGDR